MDAVAIYTKRPLTSSVGNCQTTIEVRVDKLSQTVRKNADFYLL